MVASAYNTGWMNGDIKLATLSDTDDTDLVGSELVTNGTFDTDVSGWDGSGTWEAGRLKLSAAATFVISGQDIPVEIGKKYIIEWEQFGSQAYGIALYGSGSLEPQTGAGYYYPQEEGKFSVTCTALSNTLLLHVVGFRTDVNDAIFDNVSVRLAEADRSVNNNGLQVFGTVQKNPVATGADLVAYGPFSASKCLIQPYNSGLNFGTGDLCIMGWLKTADAYGMIFQRYNGITGQGLISIETYPRTVNGLDFNLGGGLLSSTIAVNTGKWVNFVCVRRSGVCEVWIDGKLNNTVANTRDLAPTSDDYPSYIGVRRDGVQALEGSLALLRISGTAPTAEQIAKIYRDEKPLFQEGAQATLHGTSDAVTALAYDDSTELLHVGTSSGRSVFQGLERVDNTTDGVGVAISAINGLVVEE